MPTAYRGDPRARAGAAAGKRPLALVIATDADERWRAAQALAHEGLDVLESGSFEPALALLAARPVALVVVDGEIAYEVAGAVRALAGAQDSPILALVEPTGDAARSACEAGASDFAERPVDGALLRERARLLLARARESRAQRDAREQLERAERLARAGSFRVSLATGTVEASTPLFELLGLAPRAGQSVRAFAELLAADDREAAERAAQRALENDRPEALDLHVLRGDGELRLLRCRLLVRRDADGEPTQLEGSVQDLGESRRNEESRPGPGRWVELELERLLRERDAKVGVLLLALDHAERVSHALGPAAGEALLRMAAERLRSALTPGEEHRLAPRGGGRFAVIAPETGDPRALGDLARRALDALAPPFVLETHEVTLGASVGIAVGPDDGADAGTLLRNAATALSHAETQGRGGLQFYRASMNASALSRMILETKLRRALEQGEFVLHYQPLIALDSDEVVGFEGVLRWREPELGWVGPDEFIPLAEETGLIQSLGEWTLREACRQAVAWRARGVCPVPISINLSPQQLREPALAERIAAALAESGTPAGRIGVEITESVLLDDAALAIETLSRLRALGVRIALDDFGTGYSSLSYLRHLPVDALKIDRSFLADITSDDTAAALTASIVSMGIALGLRVVAEGVEQEPQRRLLRAWGCHEAQGFLFGHAVPSDEAECMWAARACDASEEPASGGL